MPRPIVRIVMMGCFAFLLGGICIVSTVADERNAAVDVDASISLRLVRDARQSPLPAPGAPTADLVEACMKAAGRIDDVWIDAGAPGGSIGLRRWVRETWDRLPIDARTAAEPVLTSRWQAELAGPMQPTEDVLRSALSRWGHAASAGPAWRAYAQRLMDRGRFDLARLAWERAGRVAGTAIERAECWRGGELAAVLSQQRRDIPQWPRDESSPGPYPARRALSPSPPPELASVRVTGIDGDTTLAAWHAQLLAARLKVRSSPIRSRESLDASPATGAAIADMRNGHRLRTEQLAAEFGVVDDARTGLARSDAHLFWKTSDRLAAYSLADGRVIWQRDSPEFAAVAKHCEAESSSAVARAYALRSHQADARARGVTAAGPFVLSIEPPAGASHERPEWSLAERRLPVSRLRRTAPLVLTAIDAETGMPAWTYPHEVPSGWTGDDGVMGSPAVTDGLVYVLMKDGLTVSLVSLDLTTGRRVADVVLGRWPDDPTNDLTALRCDARVVWIDDLLLCLTGAGQIAAVDPLTMTFAWATSYAPRPKPTIPREDDFCDASTFEDDWWNGRRDHGLTFTTSEWIVAPGDAAMVAAIDRQTGQIRWRKPVAGRFALCGAVNRTVCWIAADQLIWCDAEAGRELRSDRIGPVISSAVPVESSLLFNTVDGRVWRASPDAPPAVLATMQPGGRMAKANGRLWSIGRHGLARGPAIDDVAAAIHGKSPEAMWDNSRRPDDHNSIAVERNWPVRIMHPKQFADDRPLREWRTVSTPSLQLHSREAQQALEKLHRARTARTTGDVAEAARLLNELRESIDQTPIGFDPTDDRMVWMSAVVSQEAAAWDATPLADRLRTSLRWNPTPESAKTAHTHGAHGERSATKWPMESPRVSVSIARNDDVYYWPQPIAGDEHRGLGPMGGDDLFLAAHRLGHSLRIDRAGGRGTTQLSTPAISPRAHDAASWQCRRHGSVVSLCAGDAAWGVFAAAERDASHLAFAAAAEATFDVRRRLPWEYRGENPWAHWPGEPSQRLFDAFGRPTIDVAGLTHSAVLVATQGRLTAIGMDPPECLWSVGVVASSVRVIHRGEELMCLAPGRRHVVVRSAIDGSWMRDFDLPVPADRLLSVDDAGFVLDVDVPDSKARHIARRPWSSPADETRWQFTPDARLVFRDGTLWAADPIARTVSMIDLASNEAPHVVISKDDSLNFAKFLVWSDAERWYLVASQAIEAESIWRDVQRPGDRRRECIDGWIIAVDRTTQTEVWRRRPEREGWLLDQPLDVPFLMVAHRQVSANERERMSKTGPGFVRLIDRRTGDDILRQEFPAWQPYCVVDANPDCGRIRISFERADVVLDYSDERPAP